jgi:two-component system KDP operon response regulator KdpE
MIVSQQSRVLIVEEDPSLRKVLYNSLSADEFTVDETRSSKEALYLAQHEPFDLVLLDIDCPASVENCRRLRELLPNAGIVVIVKVRDLLGDKVQALEAVTDDYVTKPFWLHELTARLRGVLRRHRAQQATGNPVVQAGSLAMDLHRRILWRSGAQVRLSPKQFDLLAFMLQNQGVPLTRAQLLRSVWGPEYGDEVEYLRTYVHALRKKIEANPAKPEYILTEPWIGYRFRNPSDQESFG